jgi:hypothetical protein
MTDFRRRLKSTFKIEASSPYFSLSSRILAVSSHPASACRAACLFWIGKPPELRVNGGLTVIVLCNIDRGEPINRYATRLASFYTPGLEISALPEQAHSRWKGRMNYIHGARRDSAQPAAPGTDHVAQEVCQLMSHRLNH